jgi:hypothetical protein
VVTVNTASTLEQIYAFSTQNVTQFKTAIINRTISSEKLRQQAAEIALVLLPTVSMKRKCRRYDFQLSISLHCLHNNKQSSAKFYCLITLNASVTSDEDH